MSDIPEVSVLMPVYNAERYVEEAVESILNQTYRDFEFVIIDDGSTDGSLEILRRYEKQDPRIRLYTRENRGLAVTRNELLAKASGEFFAWTDADDIFYAERLSVQLEAMMEDDSIAWVQAALRVVDEEGDPLFTICGENRDIGCVGACMMRRAVVELVGGFREAFEMCEDRDLALRMQEHGRLVLLPAVLMDYRQHLASVCNSRMNLIMQYRALADALAEERRILGTDALQRGDSLAMPTATGARAYHGAWEAHRRWAVYALKSGHIRTARKHALRAARRRPFSLGTLRLLYRAARGR